MLIQMNLMSFLFQFELQVDELNSKAALLFEEETAIFLQARKNSSLR